jgi:hypothetical protein
MSQTKLYLFTAASTLEAIKISGSMDESMDGDVGVIEVEVRVCAFALSSAALRPLTSTLPPVDLRLDYDGDYCIEGEARARQGTDWRGGT